jgi:hypothetical protein
MAELKTKKNAASVTAFLAKIGDAARRKDAQQLVRMMRKATGKAPRMWGDAIVGFGDYHYRYESGHEGECFVTGFSPRKTALSLYLMGGFESLEPLLKKLGRFKTGKSCLYIKALSDVDLATLEQLIRASCARVAR